jgi:nitrate reductase NapE component
VLTTRVRPSKKARNREYPFLILEIGGFPVLSVVFAEAGGSLVPRV